MLSNLAYYEFWNEVCIKEDKVCCRMSENLMERLAVFSLNHVVRSKYVAKVVKSDLRGFAGVLSLSRSSPISLP